MRAVCVFKIGPDLSVASRFRIAARLYRAGVAALALFAWNACEALTDSHVLSFSFTHTGVVSTGTVALASTISNTVTTTAPTINIPQFSTTLGRLTKVTVTFTTTTATYGVSPSGTLTLITNATATRTLAYSITASSTTGANSNQLTNSGASLVQAFQGSTAQIGGAPLAASSVYTATADLANFTGSGTVPAVLTATNLLSVTTTASVLNGAGLQGSGTYAGSVTVAYDYLPYNVTGVVYNDADHNGFRSASETGTGLTLYAKLMSSTTGPVVQTATVDPSTGAYAFATGGGSYRIIIDDNATTSDTTALVPPAGWTATQAPTLTRDIVVTADLASQDFGLVHATGASGRLFVDDGSGSGTANDGILNGSERGLAAHAVQVLDASNNVLDTAVSAADGSYSLFIPTSVTNGATLRILPVADAAQLRTGATVGTTAGTYSPGANTVTFAFSNATAYSGVNFGSIPVTALSGAGLQSGLPGAVLLYSHRFTAKTAGSVTFSTSHTGPANVAWTEVIYLDSNGNGVIDAGEQPVTGAISMTAGQVVFLIVKVSIPEASAPTMSLGTALNATMALSNSSISASYSSTTIDVATVLALDGNAASLVLVKTVSVDTVSPGGTVVYTINFSNKGETAISNLVITDQTPAYTTFVSSTTPTTPTSLTSASTTVPSVGAAGVLRWTFTGSLAPNGQGSVQFSVTLSP